VKQESDFDRASRLWNDGELRRAYRLFRRLAEQGDAGAQLNVGYFLDCGVGVRQSVSKALSWYRRAHRQGHPVAAQNIGTVFRDRGDWKRAAAWFQRSMERGNDSAALDLAKMYQARGLHSDRVLNCLRKVARSARVSEVDAEEAEQLMRELGLKSRKPKDRTP
jgi:tetratricopeptide (TPR) repeat protein